MTAEGVVAHWVEYGKGALLFVMAPGDDRSGAFYIYDRKQGASGFWNWRTACSAAIPDERCAGRFMISGCSTSRKTLVD